eukprot:TRINITY_DN11036_c0_g2_i1.p2 TRINITY_DN11036_c0_g2~~TRINITY_DN11036_c0_g2_i1.p2  ORF type:complete len:154 (+),score=17.95 TRINITY_DN11036_c0_g2_i1:23-463(+)
MDTSGTRFSLKKNKRKGGKRNIKENTGEEENRRGKKTEEKGKKEEKEKKEENIPRHRCVVSVPHQTLHRSQQTLHRCAVLCRCRQTLASRHSCAVLCRCHQTLASRHSCVVLCCAVPLPSNPRHSCVVLCRCHQTDIDTPSPLHQF